MELIKINEIEYINSEYIFKNAPIYCIVRMVEN